MTLVMDELAGLDETGGLDELHEVRALTAMVRARRASVGDLPVAATGSAMAAGLALWVEVERWLVAMIGHFGPAGFRAAGAVDAAGWLRGRGVPGADARRLADAAEVIATVPTARDAFERGAATVSQVALLARLAELVAAGRCPIEELAPLLHAAEHGEGLQVLRDRARAVELRVRGPKARNEVARLTEFPAADGMGIIHAELAPEDQRTVINALDRIVERDWRAGHADESEPTRRDRPELRAKALVTLAHGDLRGASGRSTAEVIVIVDADTLTTGELRVDSVCRLDDGTPISGTVAQGIAADAVGVRPAVIRNGELQRLGKPVPARIDDTGRLIVDGPAGPHGCGDEPIPWVDLVDDERLDHGFAKRLATWPQHLALLVRGPTCEADRCTVPARWAKAHHVRWWTDQGPTDLENLVHLCHGHHQLVHHHGWTIERRDGTAHLVRPAAAPVAAPVADPTAEPDDRGAP